MIMGGTDNGKIMPPWITLSEQRECRREEVNGAWGEKYAGTVSRVFPLRYLQKETRGRNVKCTYLIRMVRLNIKKHKFSQLLGIFHRFMFIIEQKT